MPSVNQLSSPQRTGPSRKRWVAITAAIAVVAVGVVLLVLYGGGSSSAGY